MKMPVIVAALLIAFSSSFAKEVVLYVSHDRMHSEPVFRKFEKKTGIKVKPVFDTEVTKTAGLVNRIIAEKDNAKADVFWNSEIIRTIVLKKKGCLEKYISPNASQIPSNFKDGEGFWTGFGARGRILIVNADKLKPEQYPRSIFDLIKPEWKDKVCIANPVFGTTAAHCAALFATMGEQRALDYFSALKANNIAVLAGNAHTKQRVAAGIYLAGFTDTDDANEALLEKKPVKMIFPDQDSLGVFLIPNTVCLIKGCPHPGEAKALIDFILSPESEAQLAASAAVQMPVRKGIKGPANMPSMDSLIVMKTDYEKAADLIESSSKKLEKLLLQQ